MARRMGSSGRWQIGQSGGLSIKFCLVRAYDQGFVIYKSQTSGMDINYIKREFVILILLANPVIKVKWNLNRATV